MISVLYVDDETDLLELGKLFLEQSGIFSVTTLPSAREALGLVAREQFDLILSDYQMPGMDGIAFLKEIRAGYPNLPFILFTGRGREEVVIEAINSGADFYLQKGGDVRAQFAELAHKISIAVERRQAINALRDSEQRLSDIINFLPDATFAIDTEGTVIAWNRAIEEVTGVPASEMTGKGNNEYALPFYGHRRDLLIDLILESEEAIHNNNYAIVKKEGDFLIAETSAAQIRGEPKVFYCKASLLYNKDGNVVGAIESIRDITEAKRAEDELHAAYEQITASEEELREQYDELRTNQDRVRLASEQITAQDEELRGQYEEMVYLQKRTDESQQMLQQVLDTVPVRVFWKDKELRYLGCNESFAKDAGVSTPTDLIGKTDFDMGWKEQAEAYRADDRKVIDSGIPKIGYEEPQTTPEGNRIWIRTSKIPLRDAGGKISGILGTYEDITERKRAEESLAASEAMYRSVIENIQEVFYRTDHDGNIILSSPSSLNMLGYDSMDEVLGKPITSFYYTPENRVDLLRILSEKGVIEDYEVQLKRKDGSPVWVSTHSHYYRGPGGQIAGVEGIYRDISRRKKIEVGLQTANVRITAQSQELRARLEDLEHANQALLQNEKDFESLVECAPDAIYIANDREFIYCNNAFAMLLGVTSANQIIGTSIFDRVHPDYHDSIRTRANQVNVEMKPVGLKEAVYLKLDGTPVDVESSASPLQFRGKPAGLVILRNITDRKRSEAALQESELRLRRLLERSFDAAIIHQGGIIVYANDHANRLMKAKSPGGLVGIPVMDCVDPASEAVVRERIRTMIDSPDTIVPAIEERFRCIDGTSLDVEVMASSTIYCQNPAILTLFRDISRRKSDETSVRESEKRYRQILQNASDAIIIHEISQERPGRIREVNEKTCSMLGYTREELLDLSIPDIHRPENTAHVPAILDQLFSYGAALFRTELLTKDKKRIPVEVSNSLINLDGESVVLAMVRDMRAQLRTEQALRETNRKLSLLSSITRHDLRNKVTALMGHLTLARERSADPAMAASIARLESITGAISEHIEFTRIYEDLGSTEPIWQDVRAIISRLQVPPDLVFEVDLPDIQVYADPLLNTVFSNLLDNLIRHGKDATRVRVSARTGPERCTIIWEDNGVGIPEHEKEKIFCQGYGKNTGLGLFLSREILGITGITIRETGVPGKGARFEIIVPAAAYRSAGT